MVTKGTGSGGIATLNSNLLALDNVIMNGNVSPLIATMIIGESVKVVRINNSRFFNQSSVVGLENNEDVMQGFAGFRCNFCLDFEVKNSNFTDNVVNAGGGNSQFLLYYLYFNINDKFWLFFKKICILFGQICLFLLFFKIFIVFL